MTAPSHQTSRPSSRAGLRLLLVGALIALGSLTTSVPATAVTLCPTVGVDGTVTPAITPGADLRGCNLTGANLTGADLTNVNFEGANLTNATLTDATLAGANMWDATLTGVRSGGIVAPDLTWPSPWNFSEGFFLGPGANLAGEDLTAVDLRSQQLAGADLTGANLSGRDLSGTNFDNADLSDADLSGADLIGVSVAGTNFDNADLSDAYLESSDFSTSDMTDADLSRSRLVGTGLYLNPAGLSGANFSGASLDQITIKPYTYSSTESELTITSFYVPVDEDQPTELFIESPFSSESGFFITTIGNTGLEGADFAESITFPESLAVLDDYALQTTPVTTITFLGDVPTTEATTFDGVPGHPPPSLMTVQYRPAYEANWTGSRGDVLVGRIPFDAVVRKAICQVTFSAAGSGVSGVPASASALQTFWNQPITVSGQGTLSRSGYTFAGWSTSFDGPPVGGTYLPTRTGDAGATCQDTVLYSTWTANPSGGGSSPATTPEPSTPVTAPTVSAPAAAPTVSVATPPGASPTTVSRGQARATIGGVPTEVTRASGPAGGGFSLTAGSMVVRTTPPPTGFSAGGSSTVMMSGFEPDSSAGVFLFSEPVSLGTLTVDAKGVATGRIVIPVSVPPGDHTLQFTGWTRGGQPVLLSAGVTVKPQVARVNTSVPFADGSSTIKGPGRAAIRRAIESTAALVGPWRTTVAYPGGETHSEIGRERAQAVTRALRSGGLTGPIRIEQVAARRGASHSVPVTITTSLR